MLYSVFIQLETIVLIVTLFALYVHTSLIMFIWESKYFTNGCRFLWLLFNSVNHV